MATCNQCGSPIPDGATHCPSCGAEATVNTQQAQQTQQQTQQNTSSYGTSTAPDGSIPRTTPIDPADINANKGICILCYLGVLIFIPMLTKKNSLYVRYHAKQGAILLVMDIAAAILNSVFSSVHLAFIGSLLSLLIFIFSIIGIVNAVQGQAKEVPLFGSMDFLDNVVDKIMK